MTDSETPKPPTKLYLALAMLQSRVSGVKKDARNPHFKSRYATLDNVVSTIRPHMQEAGLCFTQLPGNPSEGGVPVTTMLIHAESGESIQSTMTVPVSKRDAQGLGSAITYGCRYALMAMLGIPPTDDDAEDSIGRGSGASSAGGGQRKAAVSRSDPPPALPPSPMAKRFRSILSTHRIPPMVLLQLIRKEAAVKIEEVKIGDQKQLDAFLERYGDDEIGGWCELFDEIHAESVKAGSWDKLLAKYTNSDKESAA